MLVYVALGRLASLAVSGSGCYPPLVWASVVMCPSVVMAARACSGCASFSVVLALYIRTYCCIYQYDLKDAPGMVHDPLGLSGVGPGLSKSTPCSYS